jgi:hypothetical protein
MAAMHDRFATVRGTLEKVPFGGVEPGKKKKKVGGKLPDVSRYGMRSVQKESVDTQNYYVCTSGVRLTEQQPIKFGGKRTLGSDGRRLSTARGSYGPMELLWYAPTRLDHQSTNGLNHSPVQVGEDV